MMLKVLGMAHEQAVKGLIRDAFSAEPWCDRWEDEDVFHSYILDVMGNQNSLALGLFSEDVLIGISLGRLRHWYNGIEYCIDDLCIASEHQDKGSGPCGSSDPKLCLSARLSEHLAPDQKETRPLTTFIKKPALKSRRTGSAFLWIAFHDLRAVPRRAHRAVDFCSEGRSSIKFFLWNV